MGTTAASATGATRADAERRGENQPSTRSWWTGLPALLTTFALTQVLLLAIPLGLIPGAAGAPTINDVKLYGIWSRLLVDGTFPVHDQMWQYPPLAGLVFAASGWLPGPPGYGFMLLATLCSATILAVLLWAGRRLAPSQRLVPAWTWALGCLALGPVLLTRFDVFPTLAAVVAIIAARRPVAAGVWLAAGALLKVWPALLLLAWPRRSLGRLAAGFGAGFAAIATALWIWSGPGSWSFLRGQSGRGLQVESLGGTAYLVAHALGFDVGTTYRFGSTEVDAAYAGVVAAVMTIIGAMLIGLIAWKRLRGDLESVPIGDASLALTCVFVATNRVFSPQFVIWLVGLGAVALLDYRTRMRAPILLILGAALAGQIVYPMWYPDLLMGAWYAVLAQVVRVALIVAATALCMREILNPDGYEPAKGPASDPASEPASTSAAAARPAA